MSEVKNSEGRPLIEEFRGEKSRKLLKCSAGSTAHSKADARELRERVADGEPFIWRATNSEPSEILNAMDVRHRIGPNWAATIAAKQMGTYYLNELNKRGYFRDLCRYCAMPLPYFQDHNPDIAPWGGLPKPTAFLVAALDDPILPIYELIARELNVPMYVVEKTIPVEFPPRFWEDCREADVEIEPHRVDQMQMELEGMIAFLETLTNRTLSESRLRDTMQLGNEMFEYLYKAIDLAGETVPAPISMADEISQIATTVVFTSSQWAVDHTRELYEEIKERVEKKEAAVPNEKVRLLYQGIPLYFSPGFYNAFEDKYGAIVLPRPSGWEAAIKRNLSNPLRALASRYTYWYSISFLPPTYPEFLLHKAKKYKVNGVMFLMAESCKILYTTRRFARRVLEEAGIPSMELIADMNDSRDWDDVKMKSLVSSFIETLTP